MSDQQMLSFFKSVNLDSLCAKFAENNVDLSMISMLSDTDLNDLGVATIGDRIRLREAAKTIGYNNRPYSTTRSTTYTNANVNDTESENPSTSTHIDTDDSEVKKKANDIFRPSRSRNGKIVKRQRCKSKVKTWTANFFCLQNKLQNKVPISSDKFELQKSGLGLKKHLFTAGQTDEQVREVIHALYPEIKRCGGFELMKAAPSTRDLIMIKEKWDVDTLHSVLSSQGKIYIRPIQDNIEVTDCLNEGPKNDLHEICKKCFEIFSVNDLREHVENCAENVKNDNLSNNDIEHPAISIDLDKGKASDDELPTLTTDYEVEELPSLSLPNRALANLTQFNNTESEIDKIIQCCVSEFQYSSEPVDILRYYQSKIVTGRKLDIENIDDIDENNKGMTNYISVDRFNIIHTTFEEINGIKDLRLCLEVEFFGEIAEDYGGPRREFFTIILKAIEEKFFNPFRDWSDKYEIIGKIMALSTLQNGKLPRIIPPELIDVVFKDTYSESKGIQDLRNGLDSLGIIRMCKEFPSLVHLFTPCESPPLTIKMFTRLLQPVFSEPGMNKRQDESNVYTLFLKYLRETVGGRRNGINLETVLKFVTGSEREPILGFSINPSITFVKSQSFIPTANTCINQLNLTIPHDNLLLPAEDVLFGLYDMAFVNDYFGLK